MNGLERIYLAYLTEPREVGVSTRRSPQHLTLVRPFLPNLSMAVEAAEEVKTTFDPFEIHATNQTMFGPEHDVPVHLIEPVENLRILHDALIIALERRNVSFTDTNYIRENYKPHISIKSGAPEITEGQTFLVDHIAVMGKGKNARTVLAKMALKKSNNKEKLGNDEKA